MRLKLNRLFFSVLLFVFKYVFFKILVNLISKLVMLYVSYFSCKNSENEPRREKTGFLHMRKQRRRSASR